MSNLGMNTKISEMLKSFKILFLLTSHNSFLVFSSIPQGLRNRIRYIPYGSGSSISCGKIGIRILDPDLDVLNAIISNNELHNGILFFDSLLGSVLLLRRIKKHIKCEKRIFLMIFSHTFLEN
jgi:hypothetical protein